MTRPGARRFRRHAVAILVTLVVNTVSFVVLAYLSDVVRPRPPRPEVKSRPIPLAERPKRKRQARKVQRTHAPAQGGPELPALDLPSNIQAPQLSESKLDTAKLLRPTADQEQATLGAEQDLILSEDLVDDPPRALVSPQPRYPASAQSKGVEGSVDMKVLIDKQGAVQQVIVTASQPPGVFDQAAVTAVRRWRFTPASFQGDKVMVWARQRLTFELE